MTTNFEETLVSVWRQALVEDRKDLTSPSSEEVIGNMELCLQLEAIGRTRYENHFPPPRSLPQMQD
jgi:hypothetical protein